MSGVENVLFRIQEIQQKINHFQPTRVKSFQNYYSEMVKKQMPESNNEVKPQPTINKTENDVQANKTGIAKPDTTMQHAIQQMSYGKNFSNLIREASKKYGVSEHLIRAVIKQESSFNPRAVSRVGAQGLMQLMPATARQYGVTNSFDPKQNIFAGTKHLKGLLNQFGGSLSKSLAAYNAGASRVIKAGGVPNIRETRNYVKKVTQYYNKMKNIK